MTGIMGAMKEEVASLTSRSEILGTEKIAGMVFYKAKLAGKLAVIVQCGIGKVNAASATQILIDRYNVERIVFTGLAGSGRKDINIGDYVLAEQLVQHDFDLTHFGREKGMIPATGKFFKSDLKLNKIFESVICELGKEESSFGKFHSGIIASGDCFVASQEQVLAITKEFDADAVEMEGAAVAQVCQLNDIPFAVLRTISDNADENALVDFKAILDKASIEEFEILKRAIPLF